MIINLNWDSSVANAPPQFPPDVAAVASFFESVIQNPITITIDVGYGEINGSRIGNGAALGESETNLQQVSYSQLTLTYGHSQLISDNPTAALNFPVSPPAGNFYVSDAEAQALGIITTTPTVDGYVGFSSQSGIFDYNTSGSVPNRQYDFEGTVAHEFSEVLGRILLVGTNINHAPSYSAYDFFHYSGAGVHSCRPRPNRLHHHHAPH